MSGEELIAQHRKMVLSLATRLRRELALAGDLEDLVAFGFGGLLEAERRYDASRGVRFQTFAYYRVRGAMLDGVRQMADLPRRAHERLKAATEPRPTAAPSALDKAFTRMSARLTSPSPVQGRYAEESPEGALLKNESIERLLRALSALPPRERAVIRGHYFEGRSLDALAVKLGVSKSWASRIHRRALRALRAALETR
jgi:RNA polymerase sigma factor for flagellar operon FliA